MTGVLDEEASDKEVIRSLLKEVARLNKLLEGNSMQQKLLFDEKGKLYLATVYEEMTERDLLDKADEAKGEIEYINTVIAKAQEVKAEATPEDAAPAAPAVPEAPALVTPPVDAAAAEAPVQPADQQAQPNITLQ